MRWHAGYHAIPVAGAGADKNNECYTHSAYCSCILLQLLGTIVGVEKKEREIERRLGSRRKDRERG